MKLISEPLPGLLELKLTVHSDDRGFFCETFNERTLSKFGVAANFVQDNESRSTAAGTVRGLHFQVDPFEQGKLVRVLRGAIFDVALDLRPQSPTYLQHSSIELAEDDFRVVWIPPGFAHGFCTLEANTTISYRTSGFYNRKAERSILWNDPDHGIRWPVEASDATLSERDAGAETLAQQINSRGV